METCPSLHARPKMQELLIFIGKSGKRYRILEELAPQWEVFAFALGFEAHITEAVKRSSMFQVEDCCHSIVRQWIEGKTRQPVTWDTFLQAMDDAGLTVLVTDLRKEF